MRFILALAAVVVLFQGCTKKADQNPNILNLASVMKIKGMDPAGSQDLYSNTEVTRVYESLLEYHPLKRPYQLQPLVAAEMPTISKDGLTYTFKLRSDVIFHDDAAFPGGKGRAVKAQDVVFSLKRLADPKVQSTGWWILDGRIKGLNEWHEALKKAPSEPTNYDTEIEGLKALDDSTVQIKLVQPYPQLLYALAMPYCAVVAREAVEKYGKEFINHAVGTGPFIMTSYNPNDSITYKRNPNYREVLYPTEGAPGDKEKGLLEDAGKRLPFVDGINVRIIVEDQPRWLHFLKGDLDLSGAIPKDNFKQAVQAKTPGEKVTLENIAVTPELEAKGIRLSTAVAMDLTYVAFNVESTEIPQLKDKRVRQAISLALDDKESITLFYNDMATSAQTPIPPGMNGYNPGYKNPWRTGDLEKAKKLLADAGFPGGKGLPPIPYDITASATSRQLAEHTAKQLDRIGVKINIVSGTWPQMLQRIQNRQTQMWGIAWGADYPDAENFLQLFYGPNASPGGMNNSYYKNKQFDALFEKARIMQDSPARTEMYKKLGIMVAEDAPVVLGLHRFVVGLTQNWIRNYRYDEFQVNRAKYLRIDLDSKKQYRK